MRGATGIILAFGLSLAVAAPSVGQDAAPPDQPPAQDTAQPKTQEAGKNAAANKTRESKAAQAIEDKAETGDATAASGSARATNNAHRPSELPPVPTPSPPKKPRKIVVREGGAREPAAQIVTGMTVEEASAQRREAEKFLDAADENLKRVAGRTLDGQQQETISQIHNYVKRALAALNEGDIPRGHTLALKAELLADDLVKH